MIWFRIEIGILKWCVILLILLVIHLITKLYNGYKEYKKEVSDIINYFDTLDKKQLAFTACEYMEPEGYKSEEAFIDDNKRCIIRCVYDFIKDNNYACLDNILYIEFEKILNKEINKEQNLYIIETTAKEYYRDKRQ